MIKMETSRKNTINEEEIREKVTNMIEEELKNSNVGVIEGDMTRLRVKYEYVKFELDFEAEEELDEIIWLKVINLKNKMYSVILRLAKERGFLEPYMDEDMGTVLQGLFAVNYEVGVFHKRNEKDGVHEIKMDVNYLTYLMNPEDII